MNVGIDIGVGVGGGPKQSPCTGKNNKSHLKSPGAQFGFLVMGDFWDAWWQQTYQVNP